MLETFFVKLSITFTNLKASDKAVALTPLCKYHKMCINIS